MRNKILALLVSFSIFPNPWTLPAHAEGEGRVFFSPNSDGIIDAAVFRLAVSNPGNVSEWEFRVADSLGQEIKKLTGRGAPPPVMEWNGRDEHNQLIKDGLYQYSLHIVTLAGNKVRIDPQELVCDRQTPSAKISVEPALFSPVEGSAKPTAKFFMDASDANGIHSWLMQIKNADTGQAVKSFYGKGGPSAAAEWDGHSDSGEPAPDGAYHFILTVRDRAGNTAATAPQSVAIDRAEPVTVVEAKPVIFSPNGDGVQDVSIFEIKPPPVRKVIEHWTLQLLNAKGKTVKRFEGSGEPPREIAWDGRDNGGRTSVDGLYAYQLLTVDNAGNKSTTIPKTMTVDNTPPKASADLFPALLSPNGDGHGDGGLFSLAIEELNGIANYSLEIRNDVGDLKKTFRGEGAPTGRLQYNGEEDGGGILIDGKYSYALRLKDLAGNSSVTEPKSMQIDTSPHRHTGRLRN